MKTFTVSFKREVRYSVDVVVTANSLQEAIDLVKNGMDSPLQEEQTFDSTISEFSFKATEEVE